jgi:hypothetical protein
MGITEYGLNVKDEEWTRKEKWVSELTAWVYYDDDDMYLSQYFTRIISQ